MSDNFLKTATRKILVIDGAMGTELMALGADPSKCLEELNLSQPEWIEKVHAKYVRAGANIIETNTFGASRLKLKEYGLEDKVEEINTQAVLIAKRAAKEKVFVAGSVGPLGKFLEPIDSLTFADAKNYYSEQISYLAKAGADLILIETQSDIQEARAALIGAKEVTDIPVFVSMTYAEDGRTVIGTDPKTAAVTLAALGVDGLSVNCSMGPEGLLAIVEILAKNIDGPIIAMPNAGLPELVDEKAIYKMTPEEFASYVPRFAQNGASIIGGCCGTTPAHIKAVKKLIRKEKIKPLKRKFDKNGPSVLSSRSQVLETSDQLPALVIGERINPTARKALAEELRKDQMQMVKDEATEQVEAGATVIDVNVSVPEIDEPATMKKAILALQQAASAPICIDSANPEALEAGLISFPGKALINSVSGEEKSLNTILPLAKKYGASLIALTLDEKGIPEDSATKYTIAEKIVKRAEEIGIKKEDIFVDTLVMAISAGKLDIDDSIALIKKIKTKLKVKTSLGISNVSHGLPQRKLINHSYLAIMLGAGLDAAIVNPLDPRVLEIFDATAVLVGRDPRATRYVEKYRGQTPVVEMNKTEELDVFSQVKEAVIKGHEEKIVTLLEKSIADGESAQNLIDNGLIKGIEEVGKLFESNVYFLPQVMASAQTMKQGFEFLKQHINADEKKALGRAVLATVFGDIHDIGKNIVAMMLENHGFEIIDLGKNVEAKTIIETIKQEKADILLLSALLTTTMPQMKVVIEELNKEGIDIPVMVGGAAVTEGYANRIHANYAKDAIEAVNRVKSILDKL